MVRLLIQVTILFIGKTSCHILEGDRSDWTYMYMYVPRSSAESVGQDIPITCSGLSILLFGGHVNATAVFTIVAPHSP